MDENNPKPFWKYIKSKRNESFGIPSLENDNKMYSDSRSKKEGNFNFSQCSPKKTMKDTPKLSGNKYPKIGQITIDLYGVQILLENINVKKHLDLTTFLARFVTVLDFSRHLILYLMIVSWVNYGIDGKILTWISKFLKHCKQRAVVDGSFSSYANIDSGVLQDTILGPLLFLLHINDLPSNVQYSKVRLFADDCLLYKEIKTPN